MKIVIDIKKREWEYLNKLVENGDQLGHYERLLVNGTPLPKEHGRLIDADRLYDDFEYADYDFEETLEYAPTVIEADKEGEKYGCKRINREVFRTSSGHLRVKKES